MPREINFWEDWLEFEPKVRRLALDHARYLGYKGCRLGGYFFPEGGRGPIVRVTVCASSHANQPMRKHMVSVQIDVVRKGKLLHVKPAPTGEA